MIGKTLLFLTITFLPTQLGKHYWGSFTHVGGFSLDYLSPTIYFTDLLIALYLLYSLPGLMIALKKNLRSITPLLLFIILNLLFSLSPLASLFIWIRWLFYLLFILSLKINKVKLQEIIFPLSVSSLLIVSLALLELVFQSSLGGAFWLLGERTFNPSTPQVAKLIINGRIILRPYATFSHPNSLAGFLLLTIFLLHLSPKTTFVRLISFLGLLITFSKTAITTALLFVFRVFKRNLLLLLIVIPLLPLIFPSLALFSTSLTNRLYLLNPTLRIIRQYPLFGTGMGGFFTALVNNLPDNQITPTLIQPVHNIFLLIFTETGLVGIFLLLFLFFRLKIYKKPLMVELLSIVFLTGGFDHYWLTLPQNKLILLLTLFFVYNKHQ